MRAGVAIGQTIARGVAYARDLVNAPPNVLTPAALSTTLILRDDDQGQQETAYLQVLGQAASWRREGATLFPFDAAGNEVARFATAP